MQRAHRRSAERGREAAGRERRLLCSYTCLAAFTIPWTSCRLTWTRRAAFVVFSARGRAPFCADFNLGPGDPHLRNCSGNPRRHGTENHIFLDAGIGRTFVKTPRALLLGLQFGDFACHGDFGAKVRNSERPCGRVAREGAARVSCQSMIIESSLPPRVIALAVPNGATVRRQRRTICSTGEPHFASAEELSRDTRSDGN